MPNLQVFFSFKWEICNCIMLSRHIQLTWDFSMRSTFLFNRKKNEKRNCFWLKREKKSHVQKRVMIIIIAELYCDETIPQSSNIMKNSLLNNALSKKFNIKEKKTVFLFNHNFFCIFLSKNQISWKLEH